VTEEEAVTTKTWVTDDGRILHVEEVADDHLDAIHAWLAVWLEESVARGDHERANYYSAWMQIASDEKTLRAARNKGQVDDVLLVNQGYKERDW
jgi:hypothetical protein